MKRWFKYWWAKELASLASLGAILGFFDACGIIPDGYGAHLFVVAIILSIAISIVWTLISLNEMGNRSGFDLEGREGSRRSLTSKYIDKVHKYTSIYRQDLLDYSTLDKKGRDFVSIRVLKGVNVSNTTSDGLIYFECTEYKAHCSDIKIKAIDLKTNEPLRVEFIDRNERDKYFEFPFKIFFHTPLKKGDDFEIGFSIDMLNELDVLKEDDEIMSISLSRYVKGVDALEFNVCLNFKPSSVHAEHKKKDDLVYDENIVSVEKYVPSLDIEKMFDIKWSNDPYIIRWKCKKPKYMFYAINYRK